MANNIDGVEWRSICPISSALDVLGDKWGGFKYEVQQR